MARVPRGVGLKGLDWDHLASEARRAIVTRVKIAENNVVAAAEELARIRLRGPEQMGSLPIHFQREGEALALLLESVGCLREARIITREDLAKSNRRKRGKR